jgi:hypothetical protein
MSYTGAAAAAQSRELLGMVLETLQRDRNIPPDVLAVSENIARAIGALFEAERASSDLDGRSSVRHAMGSLSQTMALLQDVRTRHDGIEVATRTLAEVMSRLFPLAQAPSLRPSMPPGGGGRGPSIPGAAPVPRDPSTVPPGSREKLEANVGATTESNFFVGFSGDIAEAACSSRPI